MKLNWRKLWKEFDKWIDEKENQDNFPEWPAQARKINQLVTNQVENFYIDSMSPFGAIFIPKLNWKSIWTTMSKKVKNYQYTLSWCVEKQWIRETINKEISCVF